MTDEILWRDKPVSDMTRDELVAAMQQAVVYIRELELAAAVDVAAGNWMVFRREFAIRRLRFLRNTGTPDEDVALVAGLYAGPGLGLDPVDLVTEASKPGETI
jgi:hypothetical protein